MRRPLSLTLLLAGSALAAADPSAGPARPNIVYILADDLGIGDVRAFNPEGQIGTPRLDRLASEGMRFTDMHSGSAVCTPTRYGLLTGRYAWRTRLARGVLGGYSPPLIEPGRPTVASFLKAEGYRTACVGKWHLGLDWPRVAEAPGGFGDTIEPKLAPRLVDYEGRIGGGPTALGFDEFFGISASLDMPPFVYIEGDRCEEPPTVEKTFVRTGPAAADFEAEDVLPRSVERAARFLRERAADPVRPPFFLYMPLSAPHAPIVPTEAFRGQSGINEYADFVMQVDAAVGRVLDELDATGLAGSTLVIVTSDNGCSPVADFEVLKAHDHDPSAGYRGMKADIYEGGHRVPFLARWPGRVAPGSTCRATACLTDLMATCAEVLGVPIPDVAGEDSESILELLEGDPEASARGPVVHHSIDGSFAVREGPWKLCLCPGSGGWSAPRPGSPAEEGLPPRQLFHLGDDPTERSNVEAERPEVAARLAEWLERAIAEGRSTPGPSKANDRPISPTSTDR